MADKMTQACDQVVFIYTTWPDAAAAENVMMQLIRKRLIACANVMAPATAIYDWNESVERDTEIPVIIKTTAHRIEAVSAAIKAQHPYDVPALVVLQAVGGDPAYLAWIAKQSEIAGQSGDSDDTQTGAQKS